MNASDCLLHLYYGLDLVMIFKIYGLFASFLDSVITSAHCTTVTIKHHIFLAKLQTCIHVGPTTAAWVMILIKDGQKV